MMNAITKYFFMPEYYDDGERIADYLHERNKLYIGYLISIILLFLFQLMAGRWFFKLFIFYAVVALGQVLLGMNRCYERTWVVYILNLSIPFSLAIQFILAQLYSPVVLLPVYALIYYICMHSIINTTSSNPELLQKDEYRNKLAFQSRIAKILILLAIHGVNVLLFIAN